MHNMLLYQCRRNWGCSYWKNFPKFCWFGQNLGKFR